MYTNHELGKEREEEAAKYLEEQDYQISQRNFECR